MLEILVVVGILGILAAVVIPNVLGLMKEGEDEAKRTEHHNIHVAVYTIMVKAGVSQLDSAHEDVDTFDEVNDVTVTDPDNSTIYYLNEYLYSGPYPLMQAYDIALDGSVTVSD